MLRRPQMEERGCMLAILDEVGVGEVLGRGFGG